MECVSNMTILEVVILSAICIALCGRILANKTEEEIEMSYAFCQTKGNQELQADVIEVVESSAGILGVVADGIGKENTGQICAKIAVDTILDEYEQYQILDKADYFFQTSFFMANERIQKNLGNRNGGACVLAVFYDGNTIQYANSGNIQLFIMRNEELIPITKGHTISTLAAEAFYQGKISRTEALWNQKENKIWNYIGKDGYHEIEKSELAIKVKPNDLILAMTKGIYESISLAFIEDTLRQERNLQEKVDQIVMEIEKKREIERENGTIFLLKVEG